MFSFKSVSKTNIIVLMDVLHLLLVHQSTVVRKEHGNNFSIKNQTF